MTLKEYIKSLPKDRVQLAATDLNEAAKIEQEHAALPGAIFDSADQIDGKGSGQTGEDTAQPAAPTQSFDLTNDDDVKGFIKGMELSHPELVNRLRRDERAWDDMLALDSQYTARLQRDGQVKFTGDDKNDYDFFRWAYGRGMMQSDTSIGGLATAFGRGLWQMAKGAAKLGATAAKSVANPAAAVELGATTVDAAQAAVAEYQQLGAGLAALTSGDNPQVKMAAMYELAKFADGEQKTHNAWRKAINDSFAEVPVDEDSVEFLSEAFDISNLIGAGAGKVVTTGLKRAGAAGAAELLGKSRKALGSEMLAAGLSKVPVIGTPYKRAILVGQADLLSEEAQIAYKAVAEAQADLAAKRATLAAAPAADPKDVLLKQVAEAEANVARQQAAFDVANTKLTTVRQGVTEALDLEGRGLIDRAASGAVEGAGVAVRGTGRAMTRAYRGLSELLTGEADNAAFDMAAGQVTGNLANKGNIVTRLGQDMVAAGRTMAQNGATIPYFRRLRQAEDATKLTRGAAAFIDWSHLGWATDKVGDTLKAGAAGAPVSGAFGYVASGGDLAAAAESAGAGAAYGIGGGAYGQWEAYTDPRFRYEELLANRRQFRDTLSARDVGGASQLQIFDQLDAGDQLAVSTYAQGKPDVAFRFINDRNQASGYYDRDNNVVVINKASKTPVADIFRHEVAHFVERHGLQAQVREMYLGDAEKGVIGQYTALDPLGNPVFVESTDPDGTTRYGYKLNEAGEKLKADYESKIRVVDPTFKMSDDYLASELFAEQYADRMLGGGFRRDLSRNAVDNIVDALAAKPVLKNFLGGIGLLFDQNDNVVGTGVFKELKANEGVRRLISGFTSEVSKGKKAAIEDSAEQHVFTETELRNPELATKWLQGGGAMRFGPDGKPVYDSKGVPQFLTEKEADAQQRDLANELITEIEKHVASNPEDADLMQRREIVDVNGVKRTLFSGRRIPAAVIDALEKQNRFNPHQLAHLRAASASVEKNGTGAMIAHFYQAASRKLGGKAYKTVGGRWRRDGVVGFQITKDGNVVLNSVSWEQLAENATKAAKTKLAREVYATAGMPVDTAIMADVKTYLGNLVDGKPGATDIGEARRDFINNLLGIRMAANADANPLFETTTAPKTILTNLRLDRINRMAPLDYVDVAWGPQQYRQAKANMRPETENTEPQYRPDSGQTETPEFKKWFGDWEDPKAFTSKAKGSVSAVVDENSRPKVVYHGTGADFTQFKTKGTGVQSFGILGDFDVERTGVFFAEDPAVASSFADRPGGNVVPAYLSIKSPADLRTPDSTYDVLEEVGRRGRAALQAGFQTWELFDGEAGRQFVEDLKKAGYDGAMFSEYVPAAGKSTDVWVAFDPTQIKSATGNRGTFDPNNPDIRYRPEELSSSTPDQDEAKRTANARRARAISESRFYVPSDGRGRAFHDAIARTAKEHPKGAAVEVKDVGFYTDPENLLFLSADGLAGAAIKPDGDLVSVFKHPKSTAKSSEILSEAAPLGLKLDAYDMAGFLPTLYSKWGYRPVAQVAFDPSIAPPGWDYNLLGQPPVVLMVRDPLNKAGLPDATIYNDAVRAAVPTVSYDEAMKLQQAALDRIGPVQYRPEVGPAPEPSDVPKQISARNPWGMKAKEDPLAAYLHIGTEHVLSDADRRREAALRLSRYPNFKSKNQSVFEEFRQQVVDNLLFLHDSFPETLRPRAKLWYVGGRRLVENFSGQYNAPREAVAGTIAAHSPKTDWFVNIELAKRTMGIRNEILESGRRMTDTDVTFLRGWSGFDEIVEAVVTDAVGKSYADLSPAQRGLLVRAIDGQRGLQGADLLSPEGDVVGKVRNAPRNGQTEGRMTRVSYGMTGPIIKALAILDNPSRENISKQLGEEHKIRSFYNNLLLPFEAKLDVTIDTHAVAAGLLRPFAADDLPVSHNFGSKGAGSNGYLGVSGYYGLYADAYRMAAEKRGLLPREMQSITWEAARGLFPDTFKTAKNKRAVDDIWKRYKLGELSLDETRNQISLLAGGIKAPSWAVSNP